MSTVVQPGCESSVDDTLRCNEPHTNGSESELGLTDEERFRISQIPNPPDSESWLTGSRFEGEMTADECYAARNLDWSEDELCDHFDVDLVTLRYHSEDACGCLHYEGHDVTLAECCELRKAARGEPADTADIQYRYLDVTIDFHVRGSCSHRLDIEQPVAYQQQ